MNKQEIERGALVSYVTAVLRPGFVWKGAESTGGGCWGYFVAASDGRSLMITDGDAQLPYDSDQSETVTFSYYTADGEQDGVGFCWLEPAQVNAASVRVIMNAWMDGDPFGEHDETLIGEIVSAEQQQDESAPGLDEHFVDVDEIVDAADGLTALTVKQVDGRVRVKAEMLDEDTYVCVDLDRDAVLNLIGRLSAVAMSL